MMVGLVKNTLWVTFLFCTFWRYSESNNFNKKTFIEGNNRTLARFRRQTEEQSCKGDTSKFQCVTTADCINIDQKCDTKEDCLDGSDENEAICKNVSKKCTTPAQPSHGHWIYLKGGKKGVANVTADTHNIILYMCDPGFKLSLSNKDILPLLCLPTGKWSTTEPSCQTTEPTCQKLCPKLYNTPLITVTCKNNGSVVPCDKATDNTVLTYKCSPHYEPSEKYEKSICYDGAWDYQPECIPVCGESRVSATPLIVGGREVKRGNYPWVVAVYSNKDSDPFFTNICSGSLITTNVVVTAAHCVTTDIGKVHLPKYYRVGAGKFYIRSEDHRDNDTAQYSEVSQIAVSKEYRGTVQNFRGDIALLKLKIHFALSKVVQPVCYKNLPSVKDNTVGVVSGWGYDSTGRPSEVLKEVEVLYSREICERGVDEYFITKYWVPDKLCFEFPKNKTRLCKGDGGGGLVFKNPNYKNRYFIHGVTSVIATSLTSDFIVVCPGSALYTKVEAYTEWIEFMVRKWTREDKTLLS